MFFQGWACCGTINLGFWRNFLYQKGCFKVAHFEKNTLYNLCHSLFVFSWGWHMRFHQGWSHVQGQSKCNFKVKCGDKQKKENAPTLHCSHLSSLALFLFTIWKKQPSRWKWGQKRQTIFNRAVIDDLNKKSSFLLIIPNVVCICCSYISTILFIALPIFCWLVWTLQKSWRANLFQDHFFFFFNVRVRKKDRLKLK